MLDVHQYYPSGLRVLVTDGSRSEIRADQELIELLSIYKLNPAVANNWAFKSQGIDVAKRLFGAMDAFLLNNEQNSKLSPSVRNLLKDTIQFINIGQRDVSIDAWSSIMSMEHQNGTLNKRHAVPKDAKLLSSLKVPTKDAIWHWVKHRGGFEDMLCTIRLVFGTEFA